MCVIELVDYNENMLAGLQDKKAKTRRRRGAGKKKELEQVTSTIEETGDAAIVKNVEEVKDDTQEILESKDQQKEQVETAKEEIKEETVGSVQEVKTQKED